VRPRHDRAIESRVSAGRVSRVEGNRDCRADAGFLQPFAIRAHVVDGEQQITVDKSLLCRRQA
jgi:hypothetical protein